MIYRKTQAEDGAYVDSDAARWAVDCCRRIRTQEGVNVGWTEFPSLGAALEAWHLTYDPLPEPSHSTTY